MTNFDWGYREDVKEIREKAGGLFPPVLITTILIGFPVGGAWFAGKPLGMLAEFPPVSRHIRHAPFAWKIFIILLFIIAVTVLPFFVRVLLSGNRVEAGHKTGESFPWWGWAGMGTGIIAWIFAWTRFKWFEELQPFTFSPLWFSYILVVNGLVVKRSGRCLMRSRPLFFFKLFIASALFWWFFEFLNRFVENWHYTGIEHLSPMRYVLYATLPFSTVIPAVVSTCDLLETFPRAAAGLEDFVRIDIGSPKRIAWPVLVLSIVALAGTGVTPSFFYPSLWLSPLLIIVSIQVIAGKPTIFSDIKKGDWKRLWLMALSALVCGFFWEMWNYFSYARWEYNISYVGRFRIFEMPLLGYAGYLPFGLECAVVYDWLGTLPSAKNRTGLPRSGRRVLTGQKR